MPYPGGPPQAPWAAPALPMGADGGALGGRRVGGRRLDGEENEGAVGRKQLSECDLGDGWEDYQVHRDPEEVRSSALRMGANLIRYAMGGADGS